MLRDTLELHCTIPETKPRNPYLTASTMKLIHAKSNLIKKKRKAGVYLHRLKNNPNARHVLFPQGKSQAIAARDHATPVIDMYRKQIKKAIGS